MFIKCAEYYGVSVNEKSVFFGYLKKIMHKKRAVASGFG